MTEQLVYSWLFTVDDQGGKASQVYNVAFREKLAAIEAVRRVLSDGDKAVVKVKSKLTKRLFEAQRTQPSEVMLGSRKKHPR